MDAPSLAISLYLPDDGDGLARFQVVASNPSFKCTSVIWAYAERFRELADELAGFPVSTSSRVDFALGSPNVGECTLEFSCVDGSGHVVVWVALESESPVFPSSVHQSAKVCLRVEPASIDNFRNELLALATGTGRAAELLGNEP
jgi:hypothetical protein